MPILHPTEIYKESGRLETFGPELFKLKDSRDRTFALGPTNEEVITMIARDDMRSYCSLPQWSIDDGPALGDGRDTESYVPGNL